ncbi:NAD-dependent epimerase/dehydratase family protein [Myxococcota bacterium]|nr:NAD-dependent epimerase/dehydratase family protein [Myxococcota bacterium]
MTDVSAFYAGKRVLVTGGLGFIGSNLSIRLVEAGAEVLIVDSMLPAYGATLDNISGFADRLTVDSSDVRDPDRLGVLVRDQDFVFSLAGQVSHIESMQDPMTDLEINCKSQLSLLECCRHGNPSTKIVFASTRQLYGRPQYLPVDEHHPLAPVDVNGINKLAAERYYTLYRDVYGIDTVSLRLTNTYGPRMDLESLSKGFVGVFIRQALLGERIDLFGTGEQKRDFNYVDDVVDALLLAGQSPAVAGQVYNLGHPEPVSLSRFVEILGELVPLEFTCVDFPADAERIDIGDYYGDFTKFREATGWNPTVGLREGLEQTLAYHSGRLRLRA